MIYAIFKPNAFGWAFSEDGIHWGKGQSLEIQTKPEVWSDDVRTVLGLVVEGEGKFTIFYTGFEQAPDWTRLLTGVGKETCAIGFLEVQIE